MMKVFKRWSIFLLIAIGMLASCAGGGKLKDGETLFAEKKYDLAATVLKDEYQSAESPKKKAEIAFLIGECYRMNAKYQDAQGWYELAVREGYDAIATYNYALMLKYNGKYKLAVDQFSNYARLEPLKKEEAYDQIKQCTEALKWEKERQVMDLVNLDEINTQASEYAPVLQNDNTLLFTSDRFDATGSDEYGWTGEKYSDIYLTKINGNTLQGLVPFGPPINSGFNEGTPTFNAEGTEIFFTRCGSQGKEDDFCAIWYSKKVTVGGWNEPNVLGFFSDTANVGHPFMLPDGSAMLLVSDADGGYGGNDLYISYIDVNGNFTEPKNLGSSINTAGDEMFPYVAEDGNLYFSSNGHPGLGGLDIFMATKDGNVWKDPENLKLPINSGYDDYSIWMVKTKPKDGNDPIRKLGYLTSNRPGGKGKDDIYRFTESNENLFVLEGVVLEKIFEDPKDPNSPVIDFQPVDVADVELKMYKAGFPTVGTAKTDKFGRFEFDLQKNSKYYVSADKQGYLKKSLDVSTEGLRDLTSILITIKVRLILERIYEEREIVIPNIYYDFDKATLRPESTPVLDTLYQMFVDNPDIVVEIGSHTDSRGSDEYNLKLSQARAQSVVDFLIRKGIPVERLKAVGYGETKLVNNCEDGVECTEEEHQENRRTTFKILSEKFQLESITPDSIRVDPKK